jgi:hypothetical protein
MFHNLVRFATGRGATSQQIDWAWQDLACVVAELVGPDPTPVELMLARTAAADWLALRAYQARYGATEAAKDMTHEMRIHFQKIMDRAHRRLMGSVKMLTTVRRLAIPAAPIRIVANVANVAQQINGEQGRPTADPPAAHAASWAAIGSRAERSPVDAP